MNLKQINQFKENANAVEVTLYTFNDVYQMVKSGDLQPILDEKNNIIGVNYHRNVTGVKCIKVINGVTTLGNTEEERLADEKAFNEMMKRIDLFTLQKWMEESLMLVNAEIEPDDRIVKDNRIYYVVIKDRKVYNKNGTVYSDFSNMEMSDEVASTLLTESIH